MHHYEWVESVRATGGVAQDEEDINAAIASAVNYICALLERRNIGLHGFIQSGIPYVAGYMVSCAMHGDSDIWHLNTYSDDHRGIFRKEAEKNTGILKELLSEAAQVPPKVLHYFIASSGVERGLSLREIGQRRRTI